MLDSNLRLVPNAKGYRPPSMRLPLEYKVDGMIEYYLCQSTLVLYAIGVEFGYKVVKYPSEALARTIFMAL